MALATKAPEERRRRILLAAVEVLLERGYAGTRVVDIAKAAGTSSGLVLYHFGSLEGVLAQALTTVEDEFYAELAADLLATTGAIERLRHMAKRGAGNGPAVGDWRLWLEIWVRAMRDDGAKSTREALDRRWRAALREVIDEGIAAGDFHPADADASTVRLASLMDGLAIQLALADPDMTPARMTELWLEGAGLELGAPGLNG
jgi:TetR/AcrR family transcriptional regulator, transcriptional repressor of bet genes